MTDAELLQLLPSRQKDALAAAIGQRLTEVTRQFFRDLSSFLTDERFTATDFFSLNSGPVQLQFDDGLMHTLAVWPSQLSIVLLPDPLSGLPDERIYRLSVSADARPELKACLGRVCQDVRIWILKEEFDSEEAKEVAISYVFDSDLELFYCIYLHDDLDSDYLLTGADVSRTRVKHCISLAQGGIIEPK
ncbi:MAG TPA: hypothetical protein VJU84_11350 [Pyrinomonadaceae bacterium]|nr:hypothetical protein [Pyrinomonadaceae bacterium]